MNLIRVRRAGLAALLAALLVGPAACGTAKSQTSQKTAAVTLGFSQVGSESAWRIANTGSIQSSAKVAGIDLDFQNGRQQQDNQIAAIRRFIQEKVTVIAFSPVVESGWDTVLREAKDANIPVIVTDRTVDTPDISLYKTLLGSDFVSEGRKAAQWLVNEYKNSAKVVHIAEIEGTTGSAPANDRREGFEDVIKAYPKFQIIAFGDGNFTRDKGEKVMAGFLKKYKHIDVVYAHNDEEGLGAIKAIEAAGKKPGVDMKIVTIDASRNGLQALIDGKLNYVVECNPLLGPQLMDLVKEVAAGQSVPTRVVTNDATFTREQAKAVIATRQY